MSLTANTGAQENRCFGHQKARELSAAEIDQVAGGPSYTGISNLEWIDSDNDGSADGARFDYGDYSSYP